MRIGVNMPVRPPSSSLRPSRFLADAAMSIESRGFDSAWAFDALGRGSANPEPLISLAVAASATDRIELGTCILQLPLRPPADVAHRVITLDMLACGRFVLGIGAGSTAADFAAVGADFDRRFALLDAAVREIRALLAGEPVRGVSLGRWPFQEVRPPILVGAWASRRWIRRAAEELDGWIASAGKTDWAALENGIAEFRRLGGARAVVVNVPVEVLHEDTGEDVPALVGTPSTIRRRRDRFADLGFDDLVVAPRSSDLAGIAEVLEVGRCAVGASRADQPSKWTGAR